jgi:hypothetical protein
MVITMVGTAMNLPMFNTPRSQSPHHRGRSICQGDDAFVRCGQMKAGTPNASRVRLGAAREDIKRET